MRGEFQSARGSTFMQKRTANTAHKADYLRENENFSETEGSQSGPDSSGEGGEESYEGLNFHTHPKYELFDHQVSGHMPLISSGRGRIGKPAVPQEVAFYEEVLTCYPRLRAFAPNYLGCLDMSLSEIEALSSEIILARDEDDFDLNDEQRHVSISETLLSKMSRQRRKKSLSSSSKANMWNKFMKRYCRELDSTWEDKRSRSVRFILLEDLTFPFRSGKASILDIKLGTRQYRVGASPEKVESQCLKSRTTTTGQFGLRLNGMRIWSNLSESFTVRDKYWGRSIQSDTLAPAIRDFFYDGVNVRKEVIYPLLKLIGNLSIAIESAESNCRFYSSSILLIYDGKNKIENSPHVDVRMIDFANSLSTATNSIYKENIELSRHPEDGCLLGLANLTSLLTQILESDFESP